MTSRKRRADGEASRNKILDAAAEIAGERGYEGTSIAHVSARAGLPASSIYWHFADKDELIAAVIERSFAQWLDEAEHSMPRTGALPHPETVAAGLRATAQALLDAPDFLRLGLMLILERRPKELTARQLFLQVRDKVRERAATFYQSVFPDHTDAQLQQLATFTIAVVDGVFISHEVDREHPDDHAALLDSFDLIAAAVLGAAEHLAGRAATVTAPAAKKSRPEVDAGAVREAGSR
jgi:AcrR family transcriptional regulator